MSMVVVWRNMLLPRVSFFSLQFHPNTNFFPFHKMVKESQTSMSIPLRFALCCNQFFPFPTIALIPLHGSQNW
ncbi:hypothetical protein SLEP1_g7363 [Rubroshorea leprosula]|uniref:Uncharacterized protein n=1 Tax=Rubroshorea leprosula TaxID=152421 RepID=A0AAV5I668_9ROSI|nr:hypothetical protein SLEP1_g7363 [Rubroshorea leprosula]